MPISIRQRKTDISYFENFYDYVAVGALFSLVYGAI